MSALRILYVPNESGTFRQLGFRRALMDLTDAGLVEEVSILSLERRMRDSGETELHRQELIERVRRFRPNVVFMQHVGWTGLRGSHFAAMRDAASFQLIYHEGDPYSAPLHPLPRAAGAAGRAADVVFTVGSGAFIRNFRARGAAEVRWAPHTFGPERFGRLPVDQSVVRPYDVVVVANRNRPRLRGLPNWRDRIKFVSLVQEQFGDRAAIYGRGWDGNGARGPIPFAEQEGAIRSAWLSANWDHYAREPKYFSDRLPISLASGSTHATTWHPGYESIFPEWTRAFLLTSPTPKGLVSAMEGYLSTTTPEQRVAAGIAGQQFACRTMRQDNQLVEFLNFERQVINPEAAAEAWDLDREVLDEH